MNRDEILTELAVIGNRVAREANPSNYSHEYRAQARRYFKPLYDLRKAYADIRDGDDALTVLKAVRESTFGIDYNFMSRLIEKVEK